jgi:hypothetical protein
MNSILSILGSRTVVIFISTAFSLLVLMLTLNIITVDEVALIFKMSPDATSALKLVISRIQEVTGNVLNITSQLLNKLFGWAGVNIDLSKINIDVNHHGGISGGESQSVSPQASPIHQDMQPNSVKIKD